MKKGPNTNGKHLNTTESLLDPDTNHMEFHSFIMGNLLSLILNKKKLLIGGLK